MIDLVVFDLDGTLLDPEREAPVRPAVRDAIARTLAKGVGVTLASGRLWEYSRARQLELGLTLPLVACHGASVVAADGQVLWEQRLDDGLARRLARESKDMPDVVGFYFRHRITGELVIRQNRASEPLEVYRHLLGPQTAVDSELEAYLDQYQVLKFVVFDETAEAVARWGAWAGAELSQVARTHHLLVEGTAPGIDKGTGLTRLLEHLQIPPERVLAVGDNYNDLPMFALAGTSVSMGQAPADVRAAATWVAPDFIHDGAAVALERYVLEGTAELETKGLG